ncbi:hypothetical protein TWF103_010334 [Orbilia oligospora]|nr:hypothetical protein TWF103_010334 [Orbilia oligospora]
MVQQERCKLSTEFHLYKHGVCNVQICQLNDENTTNVPQLHVCGSGECGTVTFSQAKLDKIDIAEISKPGATAWTLDDEDPQLSAKDYLAISHVWANGAANMPQAKSTNVSFNTSIFDLELMDFKWTDGGHSCLALALSTWFSRGWTAFELRSSESVKVIFRDPTGIGNVLKDLDFEIIETPLCSFGVEVSCRTYKLASTWPSRPNRLDVFASMCEN